MSELRLTLFGQTTIQKNGVAVTGFKSSKAVALLCYLAVTGHAVARTTLVSLFWGELGEANARMNLRHVLANLRELVGDHLVVTRQTVAFQRASVYWLDVEQFELGVTHSHTAEVDAALALYQGDFLAGLDLRQAPLFEEWRNAQRLRLCSLAVGALQTLADQASDPEQAIAYLRRLLSLEPWREAAHRQLMERLAYRGQVTAALAHYESCRQILAEQLAVEPAAETTALYERLRLSTQTPLLRLPAPTTPFVGRATEMALIARDLADPACRCLTLVGPGGMGKTRLALAAATEQLPHFLHGVVFVPLAAVSDSQLLAPAIAAALQCPLHGQAEPTQQLLHYLQARELLLLLDNLEQLSAGLALLTEMLTQAPRVKLLATSRERLNLRAEWVIDIGGLPFPVDEATHLLPTYSAVQLFVETARRVQSHFALTPANAAAIGRICRLVAGMPLGIELAAAWVRTLTCDEIADELARNLDLLTTTQPDVPARHQSMSAVFAHSWRLLPAAQQTLLGQLAVFRRGFRQEAAQQICGAALRDLAALVDKSLLQRDEQQGRFVLHELLRQFAAEKQATTDGNGDRSVEERHGHYYLAWLATYTDALQGEEPHLAVAAILPESENIRQAWRWAVTHDAWDALGHALSAWRNFYHLRGLYTEAANWLTEALHHCSPPAAAQPINAEWQSIQGRLLLCAAEIAVQQSRYAQALQLAEAADKVATQQAAPAHKGQAQAMLGEIRRLQWASDHALVHQQRAAPLLLQSGDRRTYAHLLLQMGKTYEQLHQWEQALALQNEALHLFEALGDGWGCTISWGALGAVHYGRGDLDQALACTQHALARAQVLQVQAEIMHFTAEIGRIYWRTHRYTAALAQLHAAVQRAVALGLGHRVSDYYRLIGHAYKDLGDFAQAHTYLEQAVLLAQKSNAPSEQIGALETIGTLAEAEGSTQTALEYSRRALQVAERSGDPRLLARCLGKVGQLYAKLDQFPLARQWLEAAVDIQQALVMRANEPIFPHNLSRLAQVLYRQGEYVVAGGYCQRCLDLLDEQGKTMFHSNDIRVEAVLTLARCYYAQGQPVAARQALQTLLVTVADPAQEAKIQAVLAQFA